MAGHHALISDLITALVEVCMLLIRQVGEGVGRFLFSNLFIRLVFIGSLGYGGEGALWVS